MREKMVRIVALRWSDSKGWRWVRERECFESQAQDWLAIFKADEPNVEFSIARSAA